MEYYCSEERCTFDGNKPYVFKITVEAYMDEHNIATVYCPYCLKKMEKYSLDKKVSINRLIGGKE